MAMKPRGGGTTNPNRPRRTIVGRVYENFKPIYEWRHENDHDSLLVYLPGFQKEFIKVTTKEHNTLRVRGERLVAGNKWNRFHEDFKVPETCDTGGIRAKLDGGILTITMPKKTINPPTTTKPQKSMATTKQDIGSAKPSSSTINATLPPQPSTINHVGYQPQLSGDTEPKTDNKSLDGAGMTTKMDMASSKNKKTKMVVAALVVVMALGVYVYFLRYTKFK